ncbi:MAG: maltose alpha-D-glucosyltransferase [Chloroflexi bacterium]|nr:maltose alpha-D-glucosyltransferase [Chloroflexota bacterium]
MEDLLWYKNAVFYEIYVRAFADGNGDGKGDFAGLTSKLDYLVALGVDCLWIMPMYPSPLLDDGYDISDYTHIHPDYGSMQDFKTFLTAAHDRGLKVIVDLVLNHTSDQHPWFQAARRDAKSPYRDYYVWSDTDRKYSEARIIFVDIEKSNWSWDDAAGEYYWHRFYASQPDLNYDNPSVQEEMRNVVKFWLDLGIDGFRADAVPYLFEREGTNCENLPETHAYLKRLRHFIDIYYPGRILLCEANQWPEDVRPYFGEGDEFHMGFHFPIMPRIFMALRRGDRSPLVWITGRTPPIPESCQWCTFLRNHDELTLEMVTPEERQWMWQEYAPEPRMRLNLGIRRRLAPLLDNDRRKIELANSHLFTLPGSPVIYYGDEIGMGDNVWLRDRDGVRTPMQWEASPGAGFSSVDPGQFYLPLIDAKPYGPEKVNVVGQLSDEGSFLNTIRRMIAVHKQNAALGWGDFGWVEAGDPAVAAYCRGCGEGERILVVNNLSGKPIQMPLSGLGARRLVDLFDSTLEIETEKEPVLVLEPYAYRWLRLV